MNIACPFVDRYIGALLYLAEGPAELLCGGTAQKVPLLSGGNAKSHPCQAMVSTVVVLCILVTGIVRGRLLRQQ